MDKHEDRLCVLKRAELQDTLFSTEAGAGRGMENGTSRANKKKRGGINVHIHASPCMETSEG